MKNLISYFVAFGLVVAASGFAFAKTIHLTVKSGQQYDIYSYGSYNRATCATGALPKAGKAIAENGTIKTRLERRTFSSGPCKGKSTKGLVIYYTSNKGFRGTDKARVTIITPKYVDGSGRKATVAKFKLTVE